MKSLLLFLIFTTSIAGCKKASTVKDELAKLPPATQVGLNTFGCLVNGKAWVAQRDDCAPFICDPAFKMLYNGDNGGSLSVFAKKIINNSSYAITIGTDSLNFKNIFLYFPNNGVDFIYNNQLGNNECSLLRSDMNNVFTSGKVVISRFDLSNRIISGTFEFTLYKSGCDTIKVTNGRFDGKLY